MHLRSIERGYAHQMRIVPSQVLQHFVGISQMIDAFFAVELFLRTGEIPNAGRLRHEPDLPQVTSVTVVEHGSLIDS